MRMMKLLVLYAGLAMGAISVPAAAETGHLIALANGDLAKIRFHGTPKPVTDAPFWDANGKPQTLGNYRGKYVLLNFWALWCAPCVREMPALDRLDAELGGADFEVVTITTGRNRPEAVDKFFAEKALDHLPKLYDPKMKFAAQIGVRGLPVTILIDPDGNEVARAQGEVEWDSEAAKTLFRAWMTGG